MDKTDDRVDVRAVCVALTCAAYYVLSLPYLLAIMRAALPMTLPMLRIDVVSVLWALFCVACGAIAHWLLQNASSETESEELGRGEDDMPATKEQEVIGAQNWIDATSCATIAPYHRFESSQSPQ